MRGIDAIIASLETEKAETEVSSATLKDVMVKLQDVLEALNGLTSTEVVETETETETNTENESEEE